MKAFAELYARLDASTASSAKVAALEDYFRSAAPADAAWAVYFLAGGRPRQLVPSRVLREVARAATGLPDWLIEASYQAVGDLAETIALLWPRDADAVEGSLAEWMDARLLPLRAMPPEAALAALVALLDTLDRGSRMVCIKLVTGAFRVGVSRLTVTRALAAVSGLDSKRVAQRLVGYTDIAARPTAQHYLRLVAAGDDAAGDARDAGQPYPFFLAHPLLAPPAEFDALLGSPARWLIEWKWDGIRAQLVKRNGALWLWSRGEELVTERFPEIVALAPQLPDGTVLDGEIVVWKEGRVQPFAQLQRRIGRKSLTPKLLAEVPAALVAFDLLEADGVDLRGEPQAARRARLEALLARASPPLLVSPLVAGDDWAALAEERAASRERGVEGLMLKARDARYGVGRTRDSGVWWKWKIEPYAVDAVLVYAQRGHGRRASLYTDFTFAVWDAPPGTPGRALVPFAKAYSGLTDAEMREVDAIVRRTTVEKFGPVRSVTPTLVFELAFEGIGASARHKSGIAVRFPRIARWRHDKPLAEADTLATLRALLPPPPSPPA